MKAILVINEMPTECIECPFHRIYVDGWLNETHCTITAKRNKDGVNTRAEWCPLKPMPQKKEVEVNEIEDIIHTEYSIEDIYTNKYIATILLATDKLISLGWNACIEELEK